MRKQILYLENDPEWRELVEPELARYGQVKSIDNEPEFRVWIDQAKIGLQKWPSIVVLEQKVKWTPPAPTMPVIPLEVRKEGYINAGVRCYGYLRNAEEALTTPVIFYTFVEPKELSAMLPSKRIKEDYRDYQCVEKHFSFEGLHQALQRLA